MFDEKKSKPSNVNSLANGRILAGPTAIPDQQNPASPFSEGPAILTLPPDRLGCLDRHAGEGGLTLNDMGLRQVEEPPVLIQHLGKITSSA